MLQDEDVTRQKLDSGGFRHDEDRIEKIQIVRSAGSSTTAKSSGDNETSAVNISDPLLTPQSLSSQRVVSNPGSSYSAPGLQLTDFVEDEIEANTGEPLVKNSDATTKTRPEKTTEMLPKTPFDVKALYEYSSPHDEDLEFGVGQIITITDEEDEDWYTGEYTNESGAKCEGIFPRAFVETFDPEAAPPRRRVQQSRPHTTSASAQRGNLQSDAETAIPSISHRVPPSSVSYKSTESPFKDRIAAFNKSASAPVVPFKPAGISGSSPSFIKKPFVAPPPNRNAYTSNSMPCGEDQPKPMSLKERMTLLQKQQQEQAGRLRGTKKLLGKSNSERVEESELQQTPQVEEYDLDEHGQKVPRSTHRQDSSASEAAITGALRYTANGGGRPEAESEYVGQGIGENESESWENTSPAYDTSLCPQAEDLPLFGKPLNTLGKLSSSSISFGPSVPFDEQFDVPVFSENVNEADMSGAGGTALCMERGERAEMKSHRSDKASQDDSESNDADSPEMLEVHEEKITRTRMEMQNLVEKLNGLLEVGQNIMMANQGAEVASD